MDPIPSAVRSNVVRHLSNLVSSPGPWTICFLLENLDQREEAHCGEAIWTEGRKAVLLGHDVAVLLHVGVMAATSDEFRVLAA